MEDEIADLKQEIKILKERISVLEGRENRRRAWNLIKLIVKIILLAATLVLLWKGYDYVKNGLPDYLNDKIGSQIKDVIKNIS